MILTIRAKLGEKFVSATRQSPASAVVLALKWASEGFQGIQIVNMKGQVHDLRTAQRRLVHGLRL